MKNTEPNFYSIYIRKMMSLPNDWRWHAVEALTLANGKQAIRVKGCVPDGVYQSGPRKGRPRYKKPIAGTERETIILQDDLDKFKVDWEFETGSCMHCGGSGLRWVGWSVDTGNRFKPCKCGRTPQTTTEEPVPQGSLL